MIDGYPTEEELRIIREWDLSTQPVSKLLDYIEPLWTYPDRFQRTKHRLYLSTGGWSGNESLVEALEKTPMFWVLYWQKSQRGGHYWFDDSMVAPSSKGFK